MWVKQQLLADERAVAMTEYAIVFAIFGLFFCTILNTMFVEDQGELVLRNPNTHPIVLFQGNDSRFAFLREDGGDPWAGIEIPNPLYGFKAQFDRIENFFALPIP